MRFCITSFILIKSLVVILNFKPSCAENQLPIPISVSLLDFLLHLWHVNAKNNSLSELTENIIFSLVLLPCQQI